MNPNFILVIVTINDTLAELKKFLSGHNQIVTNHWIVVVWSLFENRQCVLGDIEMDYVF